jgi:hypothetical protein
MKKDNLIWWIVGGLGAYALYRYYQKKGKKPLDDSKVVDIVIAEEQDKYSTPFQAEYNIVMPSDMISAKVRAKSAELRAGRFAIQTDKVQAPLYI